MYYRWIKSLLGFTIFSLYQSGTACAAPNTQYEESFDIVWDTINERLYDPDFNGVSWADSRKRFRSLVVRAESDEEFYTQINTMLFELGVSHLGVVPSDDTKQLGEAAIFGEGTVGIDARFVDGKLPKRIW